MQEEDQVARFQLQDFLDAVEDAPGDFWLANCPEVSDGGCWLVGTSASLGYSRAYSQDKSERYAHRIAYMAFRGKIPDGLEIDHLCRNRWCCNPDHLEAVTHRENIRRSPLMGRRAGTRKLFCVRGHRLAGENITILRSGARQCRSCNSERMKKYREREKNVNRP